MIAHAKLRGSSAKESAAYKAVTILAKDLPTSVKAKAVQGIIINERLKVIALIVGTVAFTVSSLLMVWHKWK